MKLVKVERGGATAEGVLVGDAVRVIGGWVAGPADACAFTLGGKGVDELERLLAASGETVALADVTLAVPIDPTAQILCAGFNYHAHLTEISSDIPNTRSSSSARSTRWWRTGSRSSGQRRR